jgi:hypothetical protein
MNWKEFVELAIVAGTLSDTGTAGLLADGWCHGDTVSRGRRRDGLATWTASCNEPPTRIEFVSVAPAADVCSSRISLERALPTEPGCAGPAVTVGGRRAALRTRR